MPLLQKDAFAGFVKHRFDKLERLRWIGQKLHLQKALVVFVATLRVEDDTRTDAHLAAPVAHHDGGPYRNVELRQSTGRQISDRTAVDPARLRLEFGDEFHRPDLR